MPDMRAELPPAGARLGSPGNRMHLRPNWLTDLTDSTREHLYACTMLPEAVRVKAQEVREIARKLVKEGERITSVAYVLIAEAEAAIAALRETMQRTA